MSDPSAELQSLIETMTIEQFRSREGVESIIAASDPRYFARSIRGRWLAASLIYSRFFEDFIALHALRGTHELVEVRIHFQKYQNLNVVQRLRALEELTIFLVNLTIIEGDTQWVQVGLSTGINCAIDGYTVVSYDGNSRFDSLFEALEFFATFS